MQRRLSREERREQTRERLVDAALQLFAERGLDVSLDEVSAAAGLTKGAVYSNFASKEELLLAIVDRRLARSDRSEIVARLADRSKPAAERLAGLASGYGPAMGATRNLVVLTLELWTAAMRNPRVHDRFADVIRRSREPIGAELAQRLGVEPAEAARTAALLVAIDIGIAVQHLIAPDELPGELYAEAYRRVLGTMLDGQPG